METSKQIIEQAKKRFKELEHKGYDWSSFYNGFLEAKALNLPVVSIKLENAVLASSTVLTISLEVFSSTPFLLKLSTN